MSAKEPTQLSMAVVDGDHRARGRLLRLLKDAADAVGYPSIDALEDSEDLDAPWVVVAGPSFADEIGLKEIGELVTRRPDVGVILVADALSTGLLHDALRAGVRDVVARPRALGPLSDAVDRVAKTLGGRLRAHDTVDPSRLAGRVVTVLAAKGGAGKSVIASNLAVALARRTEAPVALVDADLQFGDAAVLLKLAPERTIVDALNAIRRLDGEGLRALLLRHEQSGLLVLAAPVEPAFADQVAADDLLRIVRLLQSFCALVVIDTPAQLNDVVLSTVEQADEVVLVCSPEVTNVKNAKLALETLRLLDVPLSKMKLVVNRARTKGGLEVRDVERLLDLPAHAVVPADDAIVRSVNAGVPAVLGEPRSAAAKALERLVGGITVVRSPVG